VSLRKIIEDTWIIVVLNLLGLRTSIIPYITIALLLPLGFTYLVSLAFRGMLSVEAAVNMLVGVLILSLSLSMINGIGQSIAQDKLLKRLELIASYPISPLSYVFGVSIVFLLSGMVSIIVVMLAGAFAWGIAYRVLPNFAQLLIVSLIACIGLVGIGAIIGTRSTSLPQAYSYTSIVSFAVALLTPAYYPPDIQPIPIRYLSYILPTTHAAYIVRHLLGIGVYAIALHYILLVVTTIVYVLLGFIGIKWYEE